MCLVGSVIYYHNETEELKSEKQEVKSNYENLESDYHALEENYNTLQENYNKLESNHVNLQTKHKELKENFQKVESELENLRSEDRFYLPDPTYSEVKQFVAEDTTDENEYHESRYNCYDFADDFISNALSEGMAAGFGYIELEIDEPLGDNLDNSSAHAVAVFNTTDQGIVYVDVEYDAVLNDLKVGDDYLEELTRETGIEYRETWLITDISIIGWW